MGKGIQWDLDAWENYTEWQRTDRNTAKKINELIKDACRDPFTGKGKPEPLKHNLSGLWSRRINETDRLVYSVRDDTLIIMSCKGHYE